MPARLQMLPSKLHRSLAMQEVVLQLVLPRPKPKHKPKLKQARCMQR